LIDAIRVMAGLVPANHAVTGLVGFRTPTTSIAPFGDSSRNRGAHPAVDGRYEQQAQP
jgi:hypothetical protein